MLRQTPMRGFTLMELLVVVGILAALLALGLYGLGSMRHNMKLRNTRAEILVLKSAIENYKQTYGVFPDRSLPDSRGPLRNDEIIRLLCNWKLDVPLTDKSGRDPNFAREPLLERPKAEQLDAKGNWRDPWGSPYAISTLPDKAWAAYQKMVQAQISGADAALAPDEAAAIAPYGNSAAHAQYWVKLIKSQVNIYSLGPDRSTDWGYSFGDGSGYTKGAWNFYQGGDKAETAKDKRGDDVR